MIYFCLLDLRSFMVMHNILILLRCFLIFLTMLSFYRMMLYNSIYRVSRLSWFYLVSICN